MENNIDLISIESLKGMKFYIPNYQRGYRWKPQQAIDLLNDINDFAQKHKNSDNNTVGFYCLQPLVVKERLVDEPGYREKLKALGEGNLLDKTRQVINNHIKWEVIDGQQRLTTIYILLRCLGENEELYTIEYQTREKSADFLRNITNNDSDKKIDNIDYWHMTEVKKAIKNWFEGFDDKKKEFKDILLNNVKFIWYQSVEKNPIDVFTRLNIGKIKLTNAELIKALFLNRSNFNGDKDEHLKLRQNEISSQWDNIEYTFQNDEFWLFLNPKDYQPITRIELIFNIIYEDDLLEMFRKDGKIDNVELTIQCGKDEYKLFRYFYNYFSKTKNIDIQELWNNKIEPVFNAFNEWYSDIELYHYIGFILAEQTNHQAKIREIYSKWRGCNKDNFKSSLIKEISNKINCKNLGQQYQYEGGNKNLPAKTAARPILLLHNIETIIQQNKKLEEHKKYGIGIFNRFPFHLFKLEKWDVEHISSSSTNKEENQETQKEILLNCYHFVKEETQEKIMSFLNDPKDKKDYEQIKEEIDKELSEEDLSPEDKNKIWNYALLDSSTNRSYGNAVFAAKRRILMAKDRGLKINIKFDNDEITEDKKEAQSAFIPVCTRNVFLKYYSSVQSSPNYWTKADAEAYRQNILDLLKEKFEVFFSEEGK